MKSVGCICCASQRICTDEGAGWAGLIADLLKDRLLLAEGGHQCHKAWQRPSVSVRHHCAEQRRVITTWRCAAAAPRILMFHSPSLMLRMARSIRAHCSTVHALFVAESKENSNSSIVVNLFWASAVCLSIVTTEFTACAQLPVSQMEIGCVTAVDTVLRPTKHLSLRVNRPVSLYMHIFHSLRRRQPWLGYRCGCHPGSAAAGAHSGCPVPGQAQAAQEAGKPSY